MAGRWERSDWAVVLGGMVETWRAAWERRSAPSRERALRTIAEDPERVPIPDRECARCGGEIPPTHGTRARYCSDDCRRVAKTKRERVTVAA